MNPLFYIVLSLLMLVLVRFVIVLLNYLTRPFLPVAEPSGDALVSVLLPARNEEQNIGAILHDLLNQSYQRLEILVYNDQSSDNTEGVVRSYMEHDSRVKLITGDSLPQGWLGKNHACHQLALQAKGDYFLFLDADVLVSPWFVASAVAYMQHKRLVLLSMFPRQVLRSFGERVVVPSMNWILLSLLFLRLVRWSKRRSLAAANGQMMMFEGASYRINQWHQQVKSSPVEDITISRLIKLKRLSMATLLGTEDISCRMYSSYEEAINGFAKNVTAFFGGSVTVTICYTVVSSLGLALAIFGLPFPLVLLYLSSLVASRVMFSVVSEQSSFFNVLLWPLQHLAFVHIVIVAVTNLQTKKLRWKGRVISV